jgi:hypothetical protein
MFWNYKKTSFTINLEQSKMKLSTQIKIGFLIGAYFFTRIILSLIFNI